MERREGLVSDPIGACCDPCHRATLSWRRAKWRVLWVIGPMAATHLGEGRQRNLALKFEQLRALLRAFPRLQRNIDCFQSLLCDTAPPDNLLGYPKRRQNFLRIVLIIITAGLPSEDARLLWSLVRQP